MNGTFGSVAAPTIRVREGERLTVHVTNLAEERHGFDIPGAPGSYIASIRPGETRSVTFTIPKGGTYFYLDPTNAPVFRYWASMGSWLSSRTIR